MSNRGPGKRQHCCEDASSHASVRQSPGLSATRPISTSLADDWTAIPHGDFCDQLLLGQLNSSLAGTYSEEQIELAGKLGAVVALSRICSGTVPTRAVVDTLQANGLTESDVLGETPIRQRMTREASAVMLANKTKRDKGEPQAQIVRSACDSFRANFDPSGLLMPDVKD